MPEKKILIITYYWPPSGGSGVQRWLKFVKYLPEFGWQPFVFTPESPSFVQADESLLKDVAPEAEIIKFPIWEPYSVFSKLTSFGKSKRKIASPSQLVGKKKSLVHRLGGWIRGNFLIPDPKIFWVRPSVSFLEEFLKGNNIQTIVTTGPPHSLHLIGLRLKKKNPSLYWIADFRDPWSEWSFYDSFNMMTPVKWMHKQLEQKVIRQANQVVTITPFYVKRFEELSQRKVTLLTNGFDEDDFLNIQYKRPAKFTIRHIGIVYEMANPLPLVEALSWLMNENREFKENASIEFIGEVNASFQKILEESIVASITTFRKAVPHGELLDIYGDTSVLLLNIDGYIHAEGLLPGKIFEYLATGLPILAIGPVPSDANSLLRETNRGGMITAKQVDLIKEKVLALFEDWKRGQIRGKQSDALMYSRKHLTFKLVESIKSL